MQCSCGGETLDHQVQRKKKLVAMFARCIACGRIAWLWGRDEMLRIDRLKRLGAQVAMF